MKNWMDSSYLCRANQKWMELIYEDFMINPNLVEESWRYVFQQLHNMKVKKGQFYIEEDDFSNYVLQFNSLYPALFYNSNIHTKQIRVLKLINAYRLYGHQNANLDPLGIWIRERVADLDPSFHELTKNDLKEKVYMNDLAAGNKNLIAMKLNDLIEKFRQIYCGSIGVEYMHISSTKEKLWVQKRIESIAERVSFSSDEKKRFLGELTAAEGLERYLNMRFPGVKRFSLEGSDALIPILKEILRYASSSGTREIVLGMAHRGRLNVLINVLGKKPKDLFDEFSDKHKKQIYTGDVKYHMGFSSNIKIKENMVNITLAFNPSHLEIINPVIMGFARARLDRLDKAINSTTILPITIHGDAAIIGQGVVQETLNMSKVHGYSVGGTVRIVINNQIGFTTSNPLNARSAQYCTDIGKMIQAPIFHVNADDLEAVIFVTRLAVDFRNTFKSDVFIDLVCYRRHGHHEADEPSVTQPIMYKRIKQHPTSREIYADKLKSEKVITSEDASMMIDLYQNALDTGRRVVKEWYPINMNSFFYSPNLGHKLNNRCQHKVSIKRLKKLAKCISTIPEAIKMQSLVSRIYSDRQAMSTGKKLLDWGIAENLAYASIITEGISVRLSGEDSSRGAFFHRHAVIYDQNDGSTYTPLQNISKHQGQFRVWDSVLSEEAVLAFEYGYAISDPFTLTIWEAQFGDFANGAQIVIDQFISSGEKKWGRMCGLVMFLPHGYEGHGPEHSSARLERYLQLCADQNMQVCIPSNPAQLYHMLRRQAFQNIRRPLIVISPKSLLHHPMVVSSFYELSTGTFLPVIGEIDNLNPKLIKRVIMCSGKVYYDLLEQRRKNNQKDIAIIRIEQLYPFPYSAVRKTLKLYDHVHDFVWCQEEPFNQGAWYCSQHYFREVIPSGSTLQYIGRPPSSSPAEGYVSAHHHQQQYLINDALRN